MSILTFSNGIYRVNKRGEGKFAIRLDCATKKMFILTYSNGIYRVNKRGEGKLAIKYSKRHKGIINLFYAGLHRKVSQP